MQRVQFRRRSDAGPLVLECHDLRAGNGKPRLIQRTSQDTGQFACGTFFTGPQPDIHRDEMVLIVRGGSPTIIRVSYRQKRK